MFSFFRKIVHYFLQPFPYCHKKWWVVVIPSLWVFLLVSLLEPLRLSTISYKYNVVAIITLITAFCASVVIYIFPLILKDYYSPINWTRLKFCLTGSFIILLATLPISYFSYKVYILGGLKVSYTIWNILFNWYPIGFFVGIMPTLIIYFLTKHRWSRIKNNGYIEENVNKAPTIVSDNIEIPINGVDTLTLSVNDFLYAEAQKNYVVISYLKGTSCEQKILRITLTQLAELLQRYPHILRCHRSFLVNLSLVANISGNSRACTLKLYHTDNEVPVSRSFVNNIKELLKI